MTWSMWCNRRGVIEITRNVPGRMLIIATDPDAERLRTAATALARHAYDGHTLLVPGVPEAGDDGAAVAAVIEFRRQVRRCLLASGGRVMKALTVWQPWATLIAIGVKPYEFRSRPAPLRIEGERIAIHAGARPVRKAEVADLIVHLRGNEPWSTALKPGALEALERIHADPRSLPLSHVLCTAFLGEAVPSDRILPEFGGPLNDSDRSEHCNWAWPLSDIRPLVPPVPASGAQGFWEWRAP